MLQKMDLYGSGIIVEKERIIIELAVKKLVYSAFYELQGGIFC